MGLLLTSAVTIVVCLVLTLLQEKTGFGNINNKYRQIIIGILFGICACMATDFGLNASGAIVNVRDAAVVCAGLIFGGPAGIIAGTIGALYRLFWGTTFTRMFTKTWIMVMFNYSVSGGFTRIACTVGTFSAGIITALLREYTFEHKQPSLAPTLMVAATVEVWHMLLVFIFRLNFLGMAFEILKATTIPMVVANTMIVGCCTFISLLIQGRPDKAFTHEHHLSTAFRNGMFACMATSFLITVFGVFYMQYKLGVKQTEAVLKKNLSDLKTQITISGGLDTYIEQNFTWHVGETGGVIIGDVTFNEEGKIDTLTIVLNGKEWNKGEVLDASQLRSNHVYKTADNFFQARFTLSKKDTPVYGMYEMIDDKRLLISYIPIKESTIYQNITVLVTSFALILVFAAIYVKIYYLLIANVLSNIDKINKTLHLITNGNLDEKVNVRSHVEFSSLSDDINNTVDKLKNYISEAESRIDRELKYAHEIQVSALPSVTNNYRNVQDFDIFASMEPAKEVGGDFYDFFFVDTHTLAFSVSDVSGKGIPAAMFMMRAKTLLKSFAEGGYQINEIFEKANRELCENNEAEMFLTSFMCLVDIKTGQLQFANAGHNPPLIAHENGTFEYLKPKPGFVLAGLENTKYSVQNLDLLPGDTLFLYTDGITESMNADKKLYGNERLLYCLNQHRKEHVETLCASVKKDIDEFVGSADQADDITMLAFRFRGPAPLIFKKFEHAKIEDISIIADFVEEQLTMMGVPLRIIFQINVAVDEIYSNIVKHGYPNRTGPIEVRIIERHEPHRIYLRFEDEGVPFNPMVVNDPDVSLSADERAIGGLGLFMVKKTMDNMVYRYENGKNILTITKNLEEK